MKKIATWLTLGAIVAAAAACSVSVTEGDGGTATGGSGGSGGSTGGSGGTGGTAGATGGTAGSAGTTGGSGGTADAGSDTPVVTCTHNPNVDGRCHGCAFMKCSMEHCACNAVSSCKTPMLAFYACLSAPNADEVGCATTFATNANVDGSGGGLANDLATCMLSDCSDTCAGRDAGVRNVNLAEAWKASLKHSDPR